MCEKFITGKLKMNFPKKKEEATSNGKLKINFPKKEEKITGEGLKKNLTELVSGVVDTMVQRNASPEDFHNLRNLLAAIDNTAGFGYSEDPFSNRAKDSLKILANCAQTLQAPNMKIEGGEGTYALLMQIKEKLI